mgnify:CR=1 FL=1
MSPAGRSLLRWSLYSQGHRVCSIRWETAKKETNASSNTALMILKIRLTMSEKVRRLSHSTMLMHRYSIDLDPEPSQPPVCKPFLRGRCSRGSKCLSLHASPNGGKAPAAGAGTSQPLLSPNVAKGTRSSDIINKPSKPSPNPSTSRITSAKSTSPASPPAASQRSSAVVGPEDEWRTSGHQAPVARSPSPMLPQPPAVYRPTSPFGYVGVQTTPKSNPSEYPLLLLDACGIV